MASRIGGAVLAIAVVLGIGTSFSSTAQAQVRGYYWRGGDGYFDRNDNYGYRYDNYGYGVFNRGTVIRIAEQNGYRDGFSIGRRDRLFGRWADCDGSFRLQNAMDGYRPVFGAPWIYRGAFHGGFRRGYDNGFRSVWFHRW